MKKYINYCLIGFIVICILVSIFLDPKKIFSKSEKEADPSPVSAIVTEEQHAEQFFIDVPDKWTEVIDDKNSIYARIDVPDTISTKGFRKAFATKKDIPEEPLLALMEDYHPYQEFVADDMIQYLGDDNMHLFFNKEPLVGISFTCSTYDYYSMAYRDGLTYDYNRDKYAIDQEVEGFSLEECDDRIRNLCTSIGMDGEIQIVHRALDYRIMKEEAIELHMDGTQTRPDYAWSQADNGYRCSISQLCNDIPVIDSTIIRFRGDILNSTDHWCFLNRERYIDFLFNDIYDIQYEDTYGKLLDFPEIIEKYKEYTGLTIQDCSTEITNIIMRVMPADQGNGSYEMIPLWVFYGNSYYEEDDMEMAYVVIINAITGERL